MKLRALGRLQGQVVGIFAALFVLAGPVGCGSSDEEVDEQEVGLESGEGDEFYDDAAPLNNVEDGNIAENEFLNEVGGNESFNNFGNNFENNQGFDNFENGNVNNYESGLNNYENAEFSEGTAGNEIEELINDGAGDSFNNVSEDPALAGDAGSDPFANVTDLNGEAVDPFAVDAGSDPFAADSASDPFAADSASDPFAADSGSDPFAADTGVETAEPAGVEAIALAGGETVGLPAQGMVPEDGARLAYHIQVGDTLAIIAQKIYGNANNWRSLAQENNISNANLIYAGDVIFYTLSGQSRSFAQRYETAPRQSITVQAGDTLSGIAQRIYGTQAGWRTLWKENPQITNPDVIAVGTILSYRTQAGVAFFDTSSAVEDQLIADLGVR